LLKSRYAKIFRPTNICYQLRKITVNRSKKFRKQYQNKKSIEQTQQRYLTILNQFNCHLINEGGYLELVGSLGIFDYNAEKFPLFGRYALVFLDLSLDTYSRINFSPYEGEEKDYLYDIREYIYDIRDLLMEYVLRCFFIYECDQSSQKKEHQEDFFINIINRIKQQANVFAGIFCEEDTEKLILASKYPLLIRDRTIMVKDITYKDLFVALLYRHLRYFMEDEEDSNLFFECYHEMLPPGPNSDILYRQPQLKDDYLIIDPSETTQAAYKKKYLEYFQEEKKIIKEYLDTIGYQPLNDKEEKKYYPIIVSFLIRVHTSPSFSNLYEKNYAKLLQDLEKRKKRLQEYYQKNQYIKKKKKKKKKQK